MRDPLTEAHQRLARAKAIDIGYRRRRDEAEVRLERLRRDAADLEKQLAEADAERREIDVELVSARNAIRDLAGVEEIARLEGLDVVVELSHRRFRIQDEAELDDAIARVLVAAGFDLVRQAVLSGDTGRIDFLTANGLGIELKVDGPVTQVARQLHRYAHAYEIRALVLVTTRAQHRRLRGVELGVPLLVHHLSGIA